MSIEDWIQQRLPPQLQHDFFGNPLPAWIITVTITVVVYVALRLVRRRVHYRAGQLAEAWPTAWWIGFRELSAATKRTTIFVIALYVGAYSLSLPPRFRDLLNTLAALALLLQAGFWGSVLLKLALERWTRTRVQQNPAALMMMSFISYASNLVLWIIVAALMLENLGVRVTALVAGLGIGGAAVALASQNILGDLFASLSIVVDQPFLLGDFIVVGDVKGTVEQIGVKTVHIRSLTGEQLIIPSSDLLQSRIHNFKRMQERRILFKIGVTYDTPADKLAALPGVIREIIERQPSVRFDRAHFQGFGDSALNFEIVYYVLSPEFNQYMDIQQTINLDLVRRMQADQIDFAYPTQTLFMRRGDPPRAGGGDDAETT